jgi:hypothetical protein
MRHGQPRAETFAERMGRYLGKPYSPNGYGPESYGCFGVIYAYLREKGVKVPEECWTLRGTWTIRNYADLFTDIKYGESVMEAVFDAIGTEVQPNQVVAGDIIIVRHPNSGRLFPAIYGGNNHAISSFLDREVRTFALSKAFEVTKARRV